jgi:hypothetical protein
MWTVAAMTDKTKIIVFCVLVLLGGVLLGYGAFVHSSEVFPQEGEGAPPSVKSEPALVKEASVGGVRLDESGKIRQTYTGAAPKECAT